MANLEQEFQKRISFKIKFEKEQIEEQQISFAQGQDIETILNYDKIRKKILQIYKYTATARDQIQLIILNFYKNSRVEIPIHHPKNYGFLVNDMLARGMDSISVRVRRLGELLKRRKREKAPVQFDSDGSVESVENDQVLTCIKVNKPIDKPYQQTAAVRCLFCHQSSKQGLESKIAGPFYGPFTNKSYGHLLCLLWCGEVFINQESKLCGVAKAIARAQKLKCIYCKRTGASFYCHAKHCKKAGHYKCAIMKNSWHPDWSQYKTYCPECTPLEQSVVVLGGQALSQTISQRQSLKESQQVKMERG